MKNWFVFVFLVAVICIQKLWAAPDLTPIALHDTLGMVIDSVENNQYKILGPVPGFTRARFYEFDSHRYFLHIFYTKNDTPGFIAIKLYPDQLKELRYRMNKHLQGAPGSFVYQIRDRHIATGNHYSFELNDKSMIYGSLTGYGHDKLYITTQSGINMTIPDCKIIDADPLSEKEAANPSARSDPSVSRLYFMPTGKGLPKGSFTVTNHELIFTTAGYGITNHLSIYAGGTFLMDDDNGIFFIMPKASFPLGELFDVGAAVLYSDNNFASDANTLGYGVLTFGNNKVNMSLGLGANFNSKDQENPALMIGAGFQMNNFSKLVTENWLYAGEYDLHLYGLRLFGEHAAVDIALLQLDEDGFSDDFQTILWLGFNFFFGNM